MKNVIEQSRELLERREEELKTLIAPLQTELTNIRRALRALTGERPKRSNDLLDRLRAILPEMKGEFRTRDLADKLGRKVNQQFSHCVHNLVVTGKIEVTGPAGGRNGSTYRVAK